MIDKEDLDLLDLKVRHPRDKRRHKWPSKHLLSTKERKHIKSYKPFEALDKFFEKKKKK